MLLKTKCAQKIWNISNVFHGSKIFEKITIDRLKDIKAEYHIKEFSTENLYTEMTLKGFLYR